MVAIVLSRSKNFALLSVGNPNRMLMESFRRITIVGRVSCGLSIYMF